MKLIIVYFIIYNILIKAPKIILFSKYQIRKTLQVYYNLNK